MFLSTIAPVHAWLLCSFSFKFLFSFSNVCFHFHIIMALSYIHMSALPLIHKIHMYACRGLLGPNRNQRSISWPESTHQCLNITGWIIPDSSQHLKYLCNKLHLQWHEWAFRTEKSRIERYHTMDLDLHSSCSNQTTFCLDLHIIVNIYNCH